MNKWMFLQADARRIPLPDRSVDLVFGSPPYCDARTYGIGAQRDCQSWVDWMLRVTAESLRVSRGAVVWVAAGVTRDRTYWPACEGLMWEWWRRGGSAYRPCYWRRVGVQGSGGDQWFRADVEIVMCFKHHGPLPWSDNIAMGHKSKYMHGGGRNSNRLANGKRGNHPGNPSKPYTVPEIANPGNLIDTGSAGGGHLGHAIAHENEAPFPEQLAEWFVRSLCPPGGVVLDPFSGSGTTVSICDQFGRRGIGIDIRENQSKLGIQRLSRPHKPVVKASKLIDMPLFRGEIQ